MQKPMRANDRMNGSAKLIEVPGEDGMFVTYFFSNPDFFDRNQCSGVQQVFFTDPATNDSISIAARRFGEFFKPLVFDPALLHAGRYVKTSEGIYVNPPRDADGNHVVDESALKVCLNGARKSKGIYLAENSFGFAPYGSFKRGDQARWEFFTGGLARVLEASQGRSADNLRSISEFYERVDVRGFDPVENSTLSVVSLGSQWHFLRQTLCVDGKFWSRNPNAYSFATKRYST
jgi:hypothetical protein